MLILGINAYHADSSAAIFRDGKLIAATEEERFRRVKHWAGFPSEAVAFCLREVNAQLNDVDFIAIGRNPKAKLFRKLVFAVKHPGIGIETIRDRLQNARQVASIESELAKFGNGISERSIKSKIKQVEHHRAHLASAFFASPFEEAALLSVDGSGDFSTTMRGLGSGNSIEVIDSVDFPHSLGIFYTAFTQLLGFPHYGDEYKIMGLAPYGKPKYINQIQQTIKLLPNGLFELNQNYFQATKSGVISYGDDHRPVVSPLFSNMLSELMQFDSQKHGSEVGQIHMDIAASVQAVAEDCIFHLAQNIHLKTGQKALCLAGGVAQNSVANGKITRSTGFESLYVPSAGHDAGIAMGAALYVQHQILGYKPREVQWSPYTGSRFSDKDVQAFLAKKNIAYKWMPDPELFDYISEKLIAGAVVGWFNGPAEFGPRALGARSILADPRRADAKDLLNKKIKRRESFRPFAPSILKEHAADYFEVSDEVPFMEKVFPIKAEKQSLIPAVTHVDGSGRLQTVDRSVSPRYYQLIESFYRKTGVPILLNTSFNENEPIVNTPEEAYDCFARTKMDVLVLENSIIERS
jgi:carbamoyltransferase